MKVKVNSSEKQAPPPRLCVDLNGAPPRNETDRSLPRDPPPSYFGVVVNRVNPMSSNERALDQLRHRLNIIKYILIIVLVIQLLGVIYMAFMGSYFVEAWAKDAQAQGEFIGSTDEEVHYTIEIAKKIFYVTLVTLGMFMGMALYGVVKEIACPVITYGVITVLGIFLNFVSIPSSHVAGASPNYATIFLSLIEAILCFWFVALLREIRRHSSAVFRLSDP